MTALPPGERWRIVQGDALALLRDMPACSVDAIITDPPYGTNDGKGKRFAQSGDTAAAFALEWDCVLPTDWLAEAFRVLKPGGACAVFTDAKRPGDVWDAGTAVGLQGCHTFYWTKTTPPPTPRPNFVSAVEVGVYLIKPGPRTWNGGGWHRNYFECALAHIVDGAGVYRFHPTQKPVAVMAWLIEAMTDPGDLVVDPFCGSGTTGVAALRLARRFVGGDRDAAHAETAGLRCAAAAAGEREPLGAAKGPTRAPSGQSSLFEVAS